MTNCKKKYFTKCMDTKEWLKAKKQKNKTLKRWRETGTANKCGWHEEKTIK